MLTGHGSCRDHFSDHCGKRSPYGLNKRCFLGLGAAGDRLIVALLLQCKGGQDNEVAIAEAKALARQGRRN